MSLTYRVFRYIPDRDKVVRAVEKEPREKSLNLIKEVLKIVERVYENVYNRCKDENLALSASASVTNILLRAPYLFAPTPRSHQSLHVLEDPMGILLLNVLRQYYECGGRISIGDLTNINNLIGSTRSFLDSVGNDKMFVDILTNILQLLTNYELIDSGIRGLLLSPEDTRPGLNTSSILAHLLVTSGLVKPINDALGNVLNKDVALAEIVAVIHDVGKLIDYRRHVTAGMEFLRSLGLKVLAEYVERHHSPSSSVMKIVGLADRVASSIDREIDVAVRAVINVINGLASEGKIADKDKLINLVNSWFQGGDWEAGDKVLDEVARSMPLAEFHRRVVEEMGRIRGSDTIGNGNIYLCTVDIGGIQRLISRGSRLRAIVGASYLIRIVNEVVIPLALMSHGIDISSIVVLKGGNVTFLTSGNNVNEIENAIEELSTKLSERYDIRGVYVACAPIANVSEESLEGGRPTVFSVPNVMDEISRNLLRHKLRRTMSIKSRNFNVKADRCSICGLRPATRKVEDMQVCDVCGNLYELGTQYGLGSKMDLIGISGQTRRAPLEFIVGSYGRYALVRFDVNNAGSMLKSVASLGELLDLSIHLEYSIKFALQDAMTELDRADGNTGSRLDLADRFFLGLIYHGGDDAFLVLRPSAVPALLRGIQRRVDEEGFSVGIGVVVTNEEHPLSLSFEAAHRVMERAKELSKKYNMQVGKSESFMSLLYMPNSMVAPNVADTVLDTYIALHEGVAALPISHLLGFLRDVYGDDYIVSLINDVERGDGEFMKEVTRTYYGALKVLPSSVIGSEADIRAKMVIFNIYKMSVECGKGEECKPTKALLNAYISLRNYEKVINEYGGSSPFMNITMLAKALVRPTGG